MKETLEIRINYDYAHLLFRPDEGKCLSTSVRIIDITKNDPRYDQILVFDHRIKAEYGRGFFYGWEFKRKYTKQELKAAVLLRMMIKSAFEPTAEECGTVYDETVACEICGVDRKQVGPLKLKRSSIPKKDIARTIAGEVVVSERFVDTYHEHKMSGASFEPVEFGRMGANFFQLAASSPNLELSEKTETGDNPFEKSTGSEGGIYYIQGYKIVNKKEVYICPKGHLIGLNILSEPYVRNSPAITDYDFFVSSQKLGVKRGLLRPEPIYLCSPAFRRMVIDEKLTGFDFEVAHVED